VHEITYQDSGKQEMQSKGLKDLAKDYALWYVGPTAVMYKLLDHTNEV
jgi:hypothetical protein